MSERVHIPLGSDVELHTQVTAWAGAGGGGGATTVEIPEATYTAANANPQGDVLGEIVDLGEGGPRILTDALVSIGDVNLWELERWDFMLYTSPDPECDPGTQVNGQYTSPIATGGSQDPGAATGAPLVVDRYIRPALGFFQPSDVPDNPTAHVTVGVTFWSPTGGSVGGGGDAAPGSVSQDFALIDSVVEEPVNVGNVEHSGVPAAAVFIPADDYPNVSADWTQFELDDQTNDWATIALITLNVIPGGLVAGTEYAMQVSGTPTVEGNFMSVQFSGLTGSPTAGGTIRVWWP